ncbi:hypothetical protein AT959_11875 [Dechloromonas denitrificans]|uniref:Uncharacterized protein n=1 Tax=Dechloromonas denitrificans TaxID=281362 RepID=A0A133XGK5_9RHOO|nr:hypothetical protein [Dechloromonas denitrificans]KXB30071.1 hypothetical protein AT959_11875 [Dechloromonas denitrificans]
MRHDRLMRWVHRLAERSGLVPLVAYYTASLHSEKKLNAGSRLLFRIRHGAAYPLLVALLAILSAGTSLYPFGPVIVAATVFAPQRWLGVIVGATLGAVCGATGLTFFIRWLGLGLLDAYFPEIRQSAMWSHSEYWIGQYGELAIAAIAALPVPQMPALVLAALGEMSLATLALALLAGKLLKYSLYVGGVLVVLQAIRHVAEWTEEDA